MKRFCALLAACALPLGGCATTSFAPPGVQILYKDGSGSRMTCRQASSRQSDRTITVDQDVSGALTVVQTYIEAYDCSAREAADGRQWFELPAFVATSGAALAGALGGGSGWGIAGTAGSSLFNAGKAYYDPKQKAAIYGNALDALRCINNEAVGIDNFAIFKTESDALGVARDAARAAAAKGRYTFTDAPSVSVSANQQYFAMVTDAVGSVNGILIDRLSNVGTYNAASLANDIKKLMEETKAAKDAKRDGPPPRPGITETPQTLAEQMQELNLKELQKELQECVWRAKV